MTIINKREQMTISVKEKFIDVQVRSVNLFDGSVFETDRSFMKGSTDQLNFLFEDVDDFVELVQHPNVYLRDDRNISTSLDEAKGVIASMFFISNFESEDIEFSVA